MEDEKLATFTIEQARIVHQQHADRGAARESQILAFSLAAMRAPALAAAGGIAAILAVITASSGIEPSADGSLESVLIWLFVSLMLCVVAPAGAYFSQLFFQKAHYSVTVESGHPYLKRTDVADKWDNIGEAFRYAAIVFILASYVTLIVGGVKFLAWL